MQPGTKYANQNTISNTQTLRCTNSCPNSNTDRLTNGSTNSNPLNQPDMSVVYSEVCIVIGVSVTGIALVCFFVLRNQRLCS